ncbi:MAG: hypothetical protein HQL03_06385 [Nitrospirae bacterium]|nr:hypothetical protein [Nitrospirota bacterium]MBF0592477.1 hypothetical protein [Nitrospirota bacterium]
MLSIKEDFSIILDGQRHNQPWVLGFNNTRQKNPFCPVLEGQAFSERDILVGIGFLLKEIKL